MQRKMNTVHEIDENTLSIELTQGKNVIIDKEDYSKIKSYSWHAHYVPCSRSYRAIATKKINGKKTVLFMHRVVMDENDTNIIIDHISHDMLDNRKCNLRKCKKSDNNKNRRMQIKNKYGYKGITLQKDVNKYSVRLSYGDRLLYLGLYKTKEEAARVYDIAAIKYYGEYALLNFPRENYQSIDS